MDRRTRIALNGSIKKWERIVALEDGDKGSSNCPLCAEFFSPRVDEEEYCERCPVRKKTGMSMCDGSPYAKWADLEWEMGQRATTPAHMRQAKAMVRFLKRLAV